MNLCVSSRLIARSLVCTTCVEFALRHPQDRSQSVRYGYDAARGFFIDSEWNGVPDNYDEARPTYEGLRGALWQLAVWGYFAPDDLWDAFAVLRDPPLGRKIPGRVRRVIRVMRNFGIAEGI